MTRSAGFFAGLKKKSLPIAMLTAYDYAFARIIDKMCVDIVLVGDSVGTNVLGYVDSTQVTMADMLHHTAAVARGVRNAFIIGDMPYRSCSSPAKALANAAKLLHCGAHAVKLEGGAEIIPVVRALCKSGIEVCGHLGYLPQSRTKPRVVGKTLAEAKTLVSDALLLQKAGVFMIVLELIPADVAAAITRILRIPTIGIGAGPRCDGQVQVFHDMAGLSEKVFRHAKVFANGKDVFSGAVSNYVKEVKEKTFPTGENASALTDEVAREFKAFISNSLHKKKGLRTF